MARRNKALCEIELQLSNALGELKVAEDKVAILRGIHASIAKTIVKRARKATPQPAAAAAA